MRKVHVIDDLETLKTLAEPTRVALLELLVEPHSVTELAGALDVPRTRLYHHVELLEAKGLIEQVDERRAGPMTERVYALTARVLRPSARLLRDREAVTTLLFDATKADLANADLDDSQFTLGRSIAFLTPERAKAFMRELDALVERFDDAHDEGNEQPYALVCALYPSSRMIR
jgi:DNA-binding transcriptional ArsR family regulator